MPRQKAFTPDQARQYLAQKAAQGDWTPTKPLGQYKDDQVTRKAGAFRKQERAGLPISNQAARGEHPHERKRNLPAPVEQYRRVHRPQPPQSKFDRLAGAYRGARKTTVSRGKKQSPRETAVWRAQRQARAYATIDQIARTDANAAIRLAVKDKDGVWRSLFRNGWSAAAVADSINNSGLSFYEWLMMELGTVYGQEFIEEMFGGPGDLDIEISAELPSEAA